MINQLFASLFAMKRSNKRFQSRVLRVMFHLLPNRMKRMMFLCALLGKITGDKTIDHDKLLKVQAQFKNLCKDPHAMAFPVAYADRIWGKRPIESLIHSEHKFDELTDQELTRLSRQIVAMMPCWLVYNKTTSIVGEVRDLLASRNELFA